MKKTIPLSGLYCRIYDAFSFYLHSPEREALPGELLFIANDKRYHLSFYLERIAKYGCIHFFISTSLMAFAVFSYKQRILSILFSVFTYVLFILAYFVDFSILPKRTYTEDMLLFNVVVNFSAALPASVMAIYLMISLNHYNSLQLIANNKLLVKTNSELDRFVYSTSHDLRAPLASVLGLIDITSRSGNADDVKAISGNDERPGSFA